MPDVPMPRIPGLELAAGPLTGVRVGGEAPDAVAIAVHPAAGDGRPTAGPGAADVSGCDVPAELTRAEATGKAGEVTAVPLPPVDDAAVTLYLVGVGDGSPRSLRRAGAALARAASGRRRVAAAFAHDADDAGVRAAAEGLQLAGYAFSRRSAPPEEPPRVALVVAHAFRRAAVAATAVTTATAVARARDLANTPANEKDPEWLAEQARRLAGGAGLDVDVRDEHALLAGGFGGILAVGAGSARPPRLIELRYEPDEGGPRPRHVALVGKGITYDTGGLSLKPREAMLPMKTDMAAGGAVIAVMAALRSLAVPVRVTGLVPAAENMPGAGALRPGDVITHYGGRTVEVFNTDAEGRLVLADALAYADAELDPDVVVDLATLTGAATLGLGRRHGALYTADDRLAAELLRAGEDSGDRLWRMPLVEDYRPAMDSDVADLSNIGRDPHLGGGSITAALFLREFTGGRRWAHLDIAGPARADGPEHEVTKGATGFGTRVLLRWLEAMRRP